MEWWKKRKFIRRVSKDEKESLVKKEVGRSSIEQNNKTREFHFYSFIRYQRKEEIQLRLCDTHV